MKETKKGGVRLNAGRKPSDDPKIPITVYIKQSKININGGKIELGRRIVDAVNSDFIGNPVLDRVKENNKPENKNRILEQRNPKVEVKNLSQSLPQTNYTINTEEQKEIDLQRIKDLQDEMKHPPKNPIIGLTKWYSVRENELRGLKLKYNQ